MNTRNFLSFFIFCNVCSAQQDEVTYNIPKTSCTRTAMVLATLDEALSRSSTKFSTSYRALQSARNELVRDREAACKDSESHAGTATYWFQREALKKNSSQEVSSVASKLTRDYRQKRSKNELSKVSDTPFANTIAVHVGAAKVVERVAVLDEMKSRGIHQPDVQLLREEYARICSDTSMKARCKGMYHSDRAMAQQISTEDLVARLQEMRKDLK